MELSFSTIKLRILEIWNHGGFQKYFRNTGWMFFGQMFGFVLSFFIGAWMVRYLGPKNYGILSYSLAFAGLFGVVANLGVDGILNRELIKFPEKRNELLGTAFRLKLGGGILVLLIAVSLIFLIESSGLIKCLVFLYSLTFIFQSINVINIFFQSKVEAKKNVKAQIAVSFLSAILKIIIILSGLGVIWLTSIYVLESVLLGVFLIISYISSGLSLRQWHYNSSLAKKILSGSWLLILTSVSVSIYMKIDQVMIKMMIDEMAVGIYSVATKLSEVWSFIPVIICASLFPAVVNAKKTDESFYFGRLKKLFLLMLFLSLAISLIVTVFASPIIIFLFGEQYVGSIPVLAIYVWSTVGVFIGVVVGKYLLVENYLKIYFFITLFGAILNIILNLVLIPIMGIGGAATTTVISYLATVFGVFFFKETRRQSVLILKSIESYK